MEFKRTSGTRHRSGGPEINSESRKRQSTRYSIREELHMISTSKYLFFLTFNNTNLIHIYH
jgi:ATP/ADP translocase